ncbi:threonine synthase [Winogradskyella immobilis]|uniref:Threonine synthase n=1 Tax=Winogradskyella immobilis TaxID=2816852 RepID=A0ABS8EPK3_9FLAO|nr:threonine synthase [Winogradskyella immobilis]MCC1485153.1 threonine synthase [Winogradskyella immobilis]MCG0017245.1 threonine synthase [Winogradskyella immobilis]
MKKNFYSHLKCHYCGRIYDKNEINTFCKDDNQPLEAVYDLNQSWSKESLNGRPSNMWRYEEVLPVLKKENQMSLGEGFSPLLNLEKLGKIYNQSQLLLKDESGNPTGSFKARGISMAVSKAKELGVKEMCIPTAGNAGSALSAYCAKADIKAHIYMPEATPKVFQLDCEIMGANVTKVSGNISDAAHQMKIENDSSWFDITTLKEPFRLEGKKTMGYEIAEQLNWKLPDVILYPTGGGTGLIGIWKAFKELKKLGWIDTIPTRMVAVQGDGCDPVVQSFNENREDVDKYENPAETIANGLRVPKPFGDRMIMKTLYESNGTAIAISDDEMKDALSELSKTEGLFISPEGAGVWSAYKKLKANNWIKANESVVLLNTGSAYKYVENLY